MRLEHVRVEGAGIVVNAWGSRAGLVAVRLGPVPPSGRPGGAPIPGIEIDASRDGLGGLVPALEAYLDGAPLDWAGALDPRGLTEFQREVYESVRAIPWATVLTYGAVARRVGRPQAVRAVGNALHRNPFPLVVPCHRVLKGGGALGGFASGAAMKRRLLALEAGQTELPWEEK